MSLAERAAELFMIGFQGLEPEPAFEALLRDQGVSGVILFARNLSSPKQVAAQTARLQALAGELPLLIATDQEGGVVSRITGSEPVRPGNMGRGHAAVSVHAGLAGTPWPGNMTLGATASADLVQQVAEGTGRELRALGINMNLAPVLDVNNNPANPVIGVRSYGEDPELVARLGSASIEGLQSAGVLATAKHFPGHGDTAVDSHSALASVAHDRSRLEAVELLPFRRAIAVGVDAIMTAHVVFPAVEPDPATPATLSPAVLTGLLRQELGFDGLIITDCLEMRSISESIGVSEAAVRAIAAGADLVLVSHTLREQAAAISAVREAIASGRLPADRVESALRRVRAARQRVAAAGPAPDLAILGSAAHQRLAATAAERSVTAVGEIADALPVDPEQTVLLAVDPDPVVEVEERPALGSPVLQAVGELAPAMRRIGISRDLSPSDQQRALKATEGAGLVLVATYAAHLFPSQRSLVQQLLREGRKVILITQRGPYDLLEMEGITGAVVTYEDRLMPARAAVRYLLGLGPAGGRLPVTIAR